nr:VOC family protein [uncultured Dyadobacter sp.]
MIEVRLTVTRFGAVQFITTSQKQQLKDRNDMKNQITTFLTFQENDAEEAMKFYVGLFDNSKILDLQRHGAGGPAKEGSILVARFELNGRQFICSDSYIKHGWTFSPAISLFVECRTESELETLFRNLADNGKVFMPLDNYGFSRKFGWVGDKFGVTWQLNLQ